MSYILDALKKSEAKRQAESSPTLFRQQAPEPSLGSQKKTVIAWGVIGMMGLLAGLGIGWQLGVLDGLIARVTEADSVETQAIKSGQIPTPERLIAVEAEPPIVDKPEPASQSASTPDPIPEVEQATSVAVANEGLPSEQAIRATGQTVTSEPAPTTAFSEEATAPAKAPQSEEVLASVETETASVWTPSQPAYLQFWELPQPVQADLEAIKLNVHVFAPDPADRFVLINGRRFGEGDQVSQELWVFAIREEGAILDYGDYRFLLTR